MELDAKCSASRSRLFSNARNTAARLARYNGLAAEPLYHPPPLAGKLKTGPFGDYVLSVGRLETVKRVDLIIRALARVDRAWRLVIVGDGPLRRQLEATRSEAGVADRVTLRRRRSTKPQLVDLYAGALAVVFPPYDEDYGYVTLEAFLAGKPVGDNHRRGRTAGVRRGRRDRLGGRTGAARPSPDAIARLAADRRSRRALGDGGLRTGAHHHVGWRRRATDRDRSTRD